MNKRTDRQRKAAKSKDGFTPVAVVVAVEDDAPSEQDSMDAGFAEQMSASGRAVDEPEQQDAESLRLDRLNTFAAALGKKRQMAVDARRASGIEQIWREDEEFYEGFDIANSDESVVLKPRDPNGIGQASVIDEDLAKQTGSTIFLNITRPYVDFSAGRAADMLLATDDRNWDIEETPMPDVIAAMGSDTPLPEPVPGGPTTIGDAAKAMVEEARKKVQKARSRIDDWMTEGQFNAEQRKQLKDAAKVGVGILKGPFPTKHISRAIVTDPATKQPKMETKVETRPTSKRISYWDFFPSAGCGDNHQNGDGIWERDRTTGRGLGALKGTKDSDDQPIYIDSVIDQCLKEGPGRKFESDTSYTPGDEEQFEIWEYQGVAGAEDLAAAGVNVPEGAVVPVTITMVNDRVIKVARSVLDNGGFIYDVMVWQPREGHWAGIGVGRQVRAPQRMVNGGVRNMMDNAGLGGGPQIVTLKGAITPAGRNADNVLRPRKHWYLNPDNELGITDVRMAFAAIEIPMVTDELLSIIQFALKMAEDVTGLPMLMQGQQGQATDTVGGMQILSNNSNTPLRAIAKLFDDCVTVPHLLRYYEWLLLHGKDDEKGEFVVRARGSSALFERDAQNQAILQMAAIVNDPKYKINPEKWFAQFLKAQHLTAADFQYSDAEWKIIQEQQKNAPPPVDPKVQTAQIAAESRKYAVDKTTAVQQEKISKDADRDAIFAQEEARRTAVLAQTKQAELDQQERLAILEYANTNKVKLEDIKAGLADTAMRLQTQKELSAMTAGIDLHKHHSTLAHEKTIQAITPPTEPAGRAPDGEGFQA